MDVYFWAYLKGILLTCTLNLISFFNISNETISFKNQGTRLDAIVILKKF